jgi:hypothetical protein
VITGGVDLTTLATQLDGFIADAIGGTNCNFTGGDGDADNYEGCSANLFNTWIQVKKNDKPTEDRTLFVMRLCLHEKVWKFLGYDPREQPTIGDEDFTDPQRIRFRELTAGENYLGGWSGDVPTEGYWEGWFDTMYPGARFEVAQIDLWDNNGNPRIWRPLFAGGASVLHQDAGQEIVLNGTEQAYIEPQLCWPATEKDVDSVTVGTDSVRYFLFKGQYLGQADTESRDMYQVGRCLIRTNGNYGTIHQDGSANGVLWLERWMDGMAFGLPYEPLPGHWAGSNSPGEGQIVAKPIAAFATMPNNVADYAHLVWLRIMLSTGSSTGWTDYADALPIPSQDRGDNSHGFAFAGALWGDDLEIADLGLGIVEDIVADPLDVAAAFSESAGSWTSYLCRGKWVADGPVQAWDLLQSLTSPRRLAWTLNGAKYGLIKWGPPSQQDVDVVLTQNDLNKPTDTSVTKLRVSQPIDRADLSYRYNLETGNLSEDFKAHARDTQARGRLGDAVVKLSDHGLIPPSWFAARSDGKLMEQVTNTGSWVQQFRRLWEVETAALMARRHFSVNGLEVGRVKGQDL